MDKYLDDQDTLPKRHLSSSDAAVSRLNAAARFLYREFASLDAAIAAKLKLHSSDLRCLNELEHGPLSPKQIAERLELSTGSVTSLLDRLEKLSFVTREHSPTDRRSIQVSLTSQAFQSIGPLYRVVANQMTEHFGAVSEGDLETIAKGFETFALACQSGKAFVQEQ